MIRKRLCFCLQNKYEKTVTSHPIIMHTIINGIFGKEMILSARQ